MTRKHLLAAVVRQRVRAARTRRAGVKSGASSERRVAARSRALPPSAQTWPRSLCATGRPRWRQSAATSTREPRTNSRSRPAGRGTQTSPLQSPSVLATQPVAASASPAESQSASPDDLRLGRIEFTGLRQQCRHGVGPFLAGRRCSPARASAWPIERLPLIPVARSRGDGSAKAIATPDACRATRRNGTHLAFGTHERTRLFEKAGGINMTSKLGIAIAASLFLASIASAQTSRVARQPVPAGSVTGRHEPALCADQGHAESAHPDSVHEADGPAPAGGAWRANDGAARGQVGSGRLEGQGLRSRRERRGDGTADAGRPAAISRRPRAFARRVELDATLAASSGSSGPADKVGRPARTTSLPASAAAAAREKKSPPTGYDLRRVRVDVQC